MRTKLLLIAVFLSGLFFNANTSYACVQPPTAALVANPEYVITDANTILEGSGSVQGDNPIKKYEWDFDYNDITFAPDYNETADACSDGAFDGNTPHSYPTAGMYTVMLRVTDDVNLTDTAVCNVYFKNIINVPDDVGTIQGAIDAAIEGSTIIVAPGRYYENIDFNDIACTVTSTDANDWAVVAATIIDGNSNGSVFKFDGSEEANSVLTGLTLTNGSGTSGNGGGIYCNGTNPTISKCIITGNIVTNDGGGIYDINSSPTISNCFFTENNANYGGGIYSLNSSLTVTSCVFGGNLASQDGAGIYDINSSPSIINSTFNNNSATSDGGGMYNDSNSSPVLINCILWGNDAGSSGDEVYNAGSADPNFSYCDIKDSNGSGVGMWWTILGTDGGGNIDSDPNFVNTTNLTGPDGLFSTFDDGLRIMAYSRCVDAGDGNDASAADIAGQVRVDVSHVDNTGAGDPNYVDMGAYESLNVLFVDDNVSSANDGSSWDQAYAKLEDALAQVSDVNDQIWVADGTYEPNDQNDRSASFGLVANVAVYGGFEGSMGSPQYRDWTAYPTILSGDINVPGDINDNSYHVVTGADDAILDGFIIKLGNANSPNDTSGGGILCDGTAPVINNCVIRDNETSGSGGGMSVTGNSSPIVSNSFFVDNDASGGGGINIEGSSASSIVTNCVFSGNTSYDGGGIRINDGGFLTLINSTISGNYSDRDGGGMYVRSNSSDVNAVNCIFWGNDANTAGDEIFLAGGDANYSFCDINDCYDSNDVWDANLGSDDGNNIDADPYFVNIDDPDGNDGIFGTLDDGLRLLADSPCIDAADGNNAPSADILNLGRVDIGDINNTGIGTPNYADIGAYEVVNTIFNITKGISYSTIQLALNDATDFETIIVYPGTYYGNTVSFQGKSITVRSTDPNDPDVVATTIIDANNSNQIVVAFSNGEDANSVLSGLTITGGREGIWYSNSSNPSVINCVIIGNARYGIYSNTAMTLRNCVIAKNANYGVRMNTASACEIINCTVVNNNNTFAGIYSDYSAAHEIKNCIVWGNGDDISLPGSSYTVSYSCIEDMDSGVGNIHAYPMFVDDVNDDYHLWYSSPCIDTGDPNGDPNKDPDGSRINIGAYGNTDEAVSITDTDDDGLDDGWEIDNDLNPNDINDAIGDLDGDGLRNIDEYKINWNPNSDDSSSIFGLVHNEDTDINYPAISFAILHAENDEEIIVPEGIYYETISFYGKSITVRSTDPNDPNVVAATIIDANDKTQGSDLKVVMFDTNEDANSVLDGLTITGGYNGVYCTYSSPTINNCKIVDNGYRGIYTDNCSSEITNCIVNDNDFHGIVCSISGSPTISGCEAIGNGDWGIVFSSLSGTIQNCVIAKNDKGVYFAYTGSESSKIENCTISSNTTFGIAGYANKITNCIIWDNNDDLKDDTATYSCIEDGDSGSGNFSIDPQFVSTDANNFHLENWSRCIDWGDPSSDYSNEPNSGGRINLGAYGNTEEAATLTDYDSDGLPESWLE